MKGKQRFKVKMLGEEIKTKMWPNEVPVIEKENSKVTCEGTRLCSQWWTRRGCACGGGNGPLGCGFWQLNQGIVKMNLVLGIGNEECVPTI